MPSGSSLGHGAIHEPMPEGSVSSGVGGDNTNEVEMGLSLGAGAGAGARAGDVTPKRRERGKKKPVVKPYEDPMKMLSNDLESTVRLL